MRDVSDSWYLKISMKAGIAKQILLFLVMPPHASLPLLLLYYNEASIAFGARLIGHQCMMAFSSRV
jgi:hypothetical protein